MHDEYVDAGSKAEQDFNEKDKSVENKWWNFRNENRFTYHNKRILII